MDPRFQTTLLDFRAKEWNPDNLKDCIIKIFNKTDILGWKVVFCEWMELKKIRHEELKNNSLSLLKIIVEDDKNKKQEFFLKIPNLIENQFFYIGGHLKIPVLQLYDFPIIYRFNKPNQIKLRTNILSLNINKNHKDNEYYVSLFGRKISLPLLICANHTKQELDDFLTLLDPNIVNENLKSIISSCYNIWNNSNKTDLICHVGKYFSTIKNDEEKKGSSIIFSLTLAYYMDYFIHDYFKTNSILFEILFALYEGPRSDTDLKYKRIRFLEYIISPLLKKVYDMLVSVKNSKKSTFRIHQNIILEKCNVSDIIHFNFCINPVSEIASLMQLSLTGPGGFKKENVPTHLRTLDDSQKGFICPADTPDREGCGVILNLVPNCVINEKGLFVEPNKDIVFSYPISLTPFLCNDDQTRLQMASSQVKQTILLSETDEPLIRSGTEDMFVDSGTFLCRAKDNGKVLTLNEDGMIIHYDNLNEGAYIKPFFKESIMDYMIPKKNEGDTFQKGEILCESLFLRNGSLQLGRNLLVGICSWKGWNVDDGIIISKSASEKFKSIHIVDLSFDIDSTQVLLSLDSGTYKPLPEINDFLKKGEIFAKLKTIDMDADLEMINIEPLEKTAPVDCKIVNIEIYPNNFNRNIEDYNGFLEKFINKENKRYNSIREKLISHLGKEKANSILENTLSRLNISENLGKYTIDSKRIKGCHIKITAIYMEKLNNGDKLSNRHGNKGTISRILPDELMPNTPDGRKFELILNPLGIISRMNVGQIYELHLTECLNQLKYNLLDQTKEDSDIEICKVLKGFLEIIDKTKNKWVTEIILNDFEKRRKEHGIKYAIQNITLIQPAFQSINFEELMQCMGYVGLMRNYPENPDSMTEKELIDFYINNIIDKYQIYDPESKITITNPIACGYMYFLKLVHRATEKMSVRSIGPYSKRTLQPLGGKSNQGGHRLGEMEVWALIGYDALNLLTDFLTIHSDSSGLKNKELSKILQNPRLYEEDEELNEEKPISLDLLESNLKTVGIQIKKE